jgi:hypothetical protein
MDHKTRLFVAVASEDLAQTSIWLPMCSTWCFQLQPFHQVRTTSLLHPDSDRRFFLFERVFFFGMATEETCATYSFDVAL